MSAQIADQLHRLHQLILDERDCAKRLDVAGLEQLSGEKAALIVELPEAAELSDELKGLAETIRKENRRNAYLLWSALGFIREAMSFFHGQTGQPRYGAAGKGERAGASGRLLSGKV